MTSVGTVTVAVAPDPTLFTAYFQHLADASRTFKPSEVADSGGVTVTDADSGYSNSVTITLSHHEAISLAAVCNNVGGPPSGRRGDIEKIADRLGVRAEGQIVSRMMTGSVYFPRSD